MPQAAPASGTLQSGALQSGALQSGALQSAARQPAAASGAGGAGPAPAVATAPNGRRIKALNGRQKAAILVQLLLAEGAELNLAALPEDMQAGLTEQMASMRLVDRDTLMAVVTEFVETLEQVGLSFPEGIEGALKALSGRLSPGATGRLRQLARASGHADPWDRIAATDADTLADLLGAESVEVAAVALSKLPVATAAGLLGQLPGERARRIAYAVAQTEGIAPDIVQRIGVALAAELDRTPQPAFPAPPAARVGAILNSAPADLRESLLAGLDDEDGAFAQGVRKAIFTFGHIPHRLEAKDMPRVIREVEQRTLTTALAHALPQSDSPVGAAAEFILANLSQRLAANLRDEIEGAGRVRPAEGEAAMTEIVTSIRRLADTGELTLIDPDED